MQKFRTYQLAKQFYQLVESQDWPNHLRDQVLRSASSVVLNLAEGAGLPSNRQKARHFSIAMGSLRETQAALEISRFADLTKLQTASDTLAAHLYRLCE